MTGRTAAPLPSIGARITRAMLLWTLLWGTALGAAVWLAVQHEVDELLDLYRRIAALRIRNAELSIARLPAPGDASGRAQEPASLLLADVFSARTPIDTRIRNALESMGIVLLGEVAVLGPDDLRARRNFGKRCLVRVEEVLGQHGLKLRGR